MSGVDDELSACNLQSLTALLFASFFSLVSSGGIKFEKLLSHLVYLDGLFLLSNRT